MKNNKLLNVKIGKRIVVGTYAFPLNPAEKKRYGSMTHRWVCLLRSPDDENMTHYIKKVQFDLDPSFLNPKRVFTAMPYEVTEVGWGEFYIGVKIVFVDDTLEPVQLQHLLRLNPTDGSNVITTAVNETFDEIIFNEPNEWFYEKLIKSSRDKLLPNKYKEYFWNIEHKEKETMCRYICSQSYFQNETYRLLAEASELIKQIQYLQEQSQLGQTKSPALAIKDKMFNKFVNTMVMPQPNQGVMQAPIQKEHGFMDLQQKQLTIPGIPPLMEPKLDFSEQKGQNMTMAPITPHDRDISFSDRSQHPPK
ncbi:YEATS family domain-containing protein [Theileria equi strain WA]|uniref:YEATS family domain-containing protein n=1 Tax=Theileria equi strain WA TaxID=1537102 RepID=L0B2X1_THEEQ|nr:YEATS family domain-containing protein [Theileria equi strain WA]AFZ81571.1 YEATS family domain-containing protein [Theileria equi strain WA]|eukprot:XP_004831237.1 YEATS family domain-containing protein [Theileria equi strain WA]